MTGVIVTAGDLSIPSALPLERGSTIPASTCV
jgi:hypothetical protein